jgi:hypothetical protein
MAVANKRKGGAACRETSVARLPRNTQALAEIERAGQQRYERARHLPWLARATPDEIASSDPEVTRAIVARLARALRAERRRGRAGHWTYDMNRHIALTQALAAERQRLGRISPPRR